MLRCGGRTISFLSLNGVGQSLVAQLRLAPDGIGDARRKRRGDALLPVTEQFWIFVGRRAELILNAAFRPEFLLDRIRRKTRVWAVEEIFRHLRRSTDAIE